MIQKTVKSLEQWVKLKQELIEKGYRLWQWQYSWNLEEGFHAFYFNGKVDVEIITFLKAVEDDMFNSKMYKK
jgi:hypothetical protein